MTATAPITNTASASTAIVDSNGKAIDAAFLSADRFHYVGENGRNPSNPCTRTIGTRGAVKDSVINVRRTGATKVWKTRSGHFRIPVKFGLYESTAITHENAHLWHVANDCPIGQK